MIIDSSAPNPAFTDGRLPDLDLNALLQEAHSRMGAPQPWRLISARKKLGKVLFEVETEGRRLIGIAGNSPRMAHAFASLQAVWNGGMRPPQFYTVVEPVGCVPEMRIMLMERAPGKLLWPMIEAGAEGAAGQMEEAARWLASLHALQVDAPRWGEDQKRVLKWSAQLMEALPGEAARIQTLHDEIVARLEARLDLVPSHGDFHANNVFIEAGKRVTVIDVDKFGLRERAFDVGYCLAQTASMGFWALGEFGATEQIRSQFLSAYEREAGLQMDRRRMSLHMGATLLQNLNYDLTVFKTGRVEIAPAFLGMAERCVFGQDVTLRAEIAAMP